MKVIFIIVWAIIYLWAGIFCQEHKLIEHPASWSFFGYFFGVILTAVFFWGGEMNIEKFKDIFRVLFTPSCWIQNYSYSPEWDKELNRLLESDTFANYDGYKANIGGHEVWIANHPYASFRLSKYDMRPKRSTILWAHRKFISDMLDRERLKICSERAIEDERKEG